MINYKINASTYIDRTVIPVRSQMRPIPARPITVQTQWPCVSKTWHNWFITWIEIENSTYMYKNALHKSPLYTFRYHQWLRAFYVMQSTTLSTKRSSQSVEIQITVSLYMLNTTLIYVGLLLCTPLFIDTFFFNINFFKSTIHVNFSHIYWWIHEQ